MNTPTPPVLDSTTATAVPPYRHDATARTVGFHQPADDGAVVLFGVNQAFIATVPATEGAELRAAATHTHNQRLAALAAEPAAMKAAHKENFRRAGMTAAERQAEDEAKAAAAPTT